MSSILKALKKLEDDKKPDDCMPSLSNMIQARRMLLKRTRPVFPYRQFVFICTILFILSGGIWFGLSQKYSFRQTDDIKKNSVVAAVDTKPAPVKPIPVVELPPDIPQKKIPVQKDDLLTRADHKSETGAGFERIPMLNINPVPVKLPPYIMQKKISEAKKNLFARTGSKPEIEPDHEQMIMPDIKSEPDIKLVQDIIMPLPVRHKANIPEKKDINVIAHDNPSTIKNQKPATASLEAGSMTDKNIKKQPDADTVQAVETKQKNQAGDLADIPDIMDSQFELQALVWSEIPQERMVVIDGRIMKEGDSAENIKITSISAKFVVIEKNGELWKIKFGLR
ncbi:general secretion pathway protein GspB [Desulfobacterales bacterium HSG16]|nr:general secretion pathway protein GspB [Desulfobacterales bacterium HSG16]